MPILPRFPGAPVNVGFGSVGLVKVKSRREWKKIRKKVPQPPQPYSPSKASKPAGKLPDGHGSLVLLGTVCYTIYVQACNSVSLDMPK